MSESVRPVALADASVLLDWANDAGTRRNSFRAERVDPQRHVEWLWARLRRDDTAGYLLLVGPDPVAVVWYVRSGETAEVSVTVAPDRRGRGFGIRALDQTAGLACEALGVRRLRALVYADNAASLGAFKRAGYAVKGRECRVLEKVVG